MRTDSSINLVWFLAGVGLGTAAGILMAPKPGADTRRLIGSRAGEARQYLSTHGHDYYELGRDLYERGRQLADEAADMFDEGRRLVEEARTEATSA